MPETITATIQQTEKLGTLWCAFMHDAPMWPIHGAYQCRTCGRHYPVPWAAKTRAQNSDLFPSLLEPSASRRAS
jgi:hypothetical protein